MDCEKVGSLIYKLRKEKNMTQKQIADLLNISDKTVSKWERYLYKYIRHNLKNPFISTLS